MKDFSFWKVYEGTAEGSGRSEKIWLVNPDTNQIGLFKFKKDSNTTDHISECISCDLANLLGIPCAKFELGIYNHREGSLSYSIVKRDDEELIEGINYINRIYPNYDAEKFYDTICGHKYSLEMIKKALDGVIDFSDFLVIPIFDYLIGNSDRHQSNWGILKRGEERKLCPLYDNSSSLCAYLSEEQMKAYLGKDVLRWKSMVETKSKSLIRTTLGDECRPTHLKMMKYIKEHYFEETKDVVKNIIEKVNDNSIDIILSKYTDNELCVEKRCIIKKFLCEKIETLSKLYFEEEK